MALNYVAPGAITQIATVFRGANNKPLGTPKRMVSFLVRAPDGTPVAQGDGEQDMQDPSRWTGVFVMPPDVPIFPDGQKFDLIWLLETDKGTFTQIERFNVVVPTDAAFTQTDIVALKGRPFSDFIHVITGSQNIKAVLLKGDKSNTTLETLTPHKVANTSTGEIWRVDSQYLTIPSTQPTDVAFSPYLLEWSYDTVFGMPQVDYHFVYYASIPTLILMRNVTDLIDKIHNEDINPALQFPPVEVAKGVYRAMDFVNGLPPGLTSWMVSTMPPAMNRILVYGAAAELASAQCTAESILKFNFSGASTTLDVDRSEVWCTQASTWRQTAMEDGKPIKSQLVRANAAVLGIIPGVRTNRRVDVSQTMRSILTPGFSGVSSGGIALFA